MHYTTQYTYIHSPESGNDAALISAGPPHRGLSPALHPRAVGEGRLDSLFITREAAGYLSPSSFPRAIRCDAITSPAPPAAFEGEAVVYANPASSVYLHSTQVLCIYSLGTAARSSVVACKNVSILAIRVRNSSRVRITITGKADVYHPRPMAQGSRPAARGSIQPDRQDT